MARASRLRRRYTVVRLVATLVGVGAAAALLLRALRRLLSSRGLSVPGVGLLRFTPTVAPHLPLREVRLETDIPTPPVPGVVYLIVGGLRMSDAAVASADSSCPVEACCQPSATISMLMAWTNVPCHEMVMDLGAKPAWLAQRVGKPDAAKLTTPMAFLNGRWITDSKDIREALRVECGAAASHGGMWAEPPLLSSAAAVEHVGMPTWKAVREAQWTTQADHPCVVAYAPLEAALAKMPFLGGQSPSWADAVAAPWAEGTRAADRLLSAAPRVPLDWASALPNVCAWLDTRMLPLLSTRTTCGRRLDLLIALKFATRMPAVVPRYPKGIYDEIDAERAAFAHLTPLTQQDAVAAAASPSAHNASGTAAPAEGETELCI